MHSKVLNCGTIKQKWNVYIDVLRWKWWKLICELWEQPIQGIVLHVFILWRRWEKHMTAGKCVSVYDLSTHFHQCALRTCWQPFEGATRLYMTRAWHINKRHPSISTIKVYTVYILNGRMTGFTLMWLLLTPPTFGKHTGICSLVTSVSHEGHTNILAKLLLMWVCRVQRVFLPVCQHRVQYGSVISTHFRGTSFHNCCILPQTHRGVGVSASAHLSSLNEIKTWRRVSQRHLSKQVFKWEKSDRPLNEFLGDLSFRININDQAEDKGWVLSGQTCFDCN